MWLIGDKGPTSAGRWTPRPSRRRPPTVLTDLGDFHALAFTVEPGNGSPQPTGKILAKLSLT